MGDLTQGQILTQAGLAAGDDLVLAFARVWLDAWLKRTAKSWTWPMLKKRVNNVPMARGDAQTIVGNGTNSNFHIHSIINGQVMWRASAGYSPRGRMFIRPLSQMNPDTDEDMTDPLTRMGAPETCYVRSGNGLTPTDGYVQIFPNPTPDRAIVLAFDAHIIPVSLPSGVAGDTQVPWYPSDRTLLQAAKCAILEYTTSGEKSQLFDDEMAKLAAMVVDDRDFDGAKAGDNQLMDYDPAVFR